MQPALVMREGNGIFRLQGWTTADARGEVVAALAPWRHRLPVVHLPVHADLGPRGRAADRGPYADQAHAVSASASSMSSRLRTSSGR